MRRVATLLLLLLVASSVEAQSSTYAWFQGPEGFRTYQMRGGRPVGHRDGLFVAVGDELVEVRTEVVSADAWLCEGGLRERRDPGRRNQGLRLVAAGESVTHVLLEATGVEGNEHVEDRIIIHGSLGPYLSVERRADYFAACSAHPSPNRVFHWFDLRSGESLDVSATERPSAALPPGAEPHVARAERALRRRFARALERPDHQWDPSVEPFWVEGVTPRFAGHRWESRVHVALGVPYAWSGSIAAYQIETQVDSDRFADWMPSSLTRVPSPVVRLARRLRGYRLGGVSGG